MRIKAVKVWVCPACDEVHLVSEEPLPPVEIQYQCSECDTIYEEKDEAKECCK